MNDILKKDFYNEIMNEFKSINYSMKELPEEKKDPFDFYDIRDLFLIYVNWRKRFITRGSRKVVYSKELKEKLAKDKKTKKIVEKIEYKFKNYEDLTPFLTKMIVHKPHVPSKPNNEFSNLSQEQKEKELRVKGDKDLLLNFFGIQHLHVDSKYNNRTTKGINFTVDENNRRGEKLLYAKVDKDIVYLIDINNHNLHDRDILVIMKNNWDFLLQPYESKLSYVTEYSNEETIECLQNGINVPYKIGDKVYMFLGISAVGTSHMEFFHSKEFFNKIQEQYNELMVLKKDAILNQIKKLNNDIAKNTNLEIHIIIKNGLLFFIDKISLATIKFQDNDIYISNNYCKIGDHSYDFNS